MPDKQTENEIRERVAAWARASAGGDIETIMAQYLPGVRAFDAIGEPQFDGVEAYRRHWETCLGYMTPGMTFEARQVRVEAGDGLAVAHFIVACGGPGEDGSEQIGYSRGTQVYRRTADGWRIAHEHFSMPIDLETGQALHSKAP